MKLAEETYKEKRKKYENNLMADISNIKYIL